MPLTPEEERELAILEAQELAAKNNPKSAITTSGLTPEEEAELAQLEAAEAKNNEPGILSKGLDMVSRALDYTGGLARTTLAGLNDQKLEEMGLENHKLSRDGDFSRALKGKAPTSDEYLGRGGVPEGVFRTTAGFVGDAITDPMTWFSGGTSALLKNAGAKIAAKGAGQSAAKQLLAKTAGKAVSGSRFLYDPTDGIAAGGKKLYKSAFKKIENRLDERQLAPLSDDLFEQGFRGTYGDLKKFSDKRLSQLGAQRKALYDEADKAGGYVDPFLAETEARQHIANIRGQGYGSKQRADSMLETINQAPTPDRKGGLSLGLASDIKTDLYDKLPVSAFDPNGRLTSDGKKLLQELAAGYKREIVNAGNLARTGLGDEVNSLNQTMGAYLGAAKPTNKEIIKAGNKDFISQTKAAVATLSPKTAAAMYGAGFINSPWFKTNVGMGVNKAAQPIAGGVRRGAINLMSNEDEQSPWMTLGK